MSGGQRHSRRHVAKGSTMKAPKLATAASASNFPFLMPDQPSMTTVETWCESSARRRRAGTHSSSSRRIGCQSFLRRFEYRYGSLAGHRRKVLQKFFQGRRSFKVIEKVLDWHSGNSPAPQRTNRATSLHHMPHIHAQYQGRQAQFSIDGGERLQTGQNRATAVEKEFVP